jgi:mutator protein MutT
MKKEGIKEIEAVCAVIERDGKFLITKRMEHSPMGHCWEFPGGKREKGETIEECAVRECQEEIDVTVEPIRKLKDLHYDYPHGLIYLHFVLCRLIKGEPRPVECREARWIDPKEFKDFEFPAADIEVIEELLSGKLMKTD